MLKKENYLIFFRFHFLNDREGILLSVVGIRRRFVGIQHVGRNSRRLRRNSRPVGRNSRSLHRNSARWWEFAVASSEFSPLVGIRGRFVGIQPVGGNSRSASSEFRPVGRNSRSLRRNSARWWEFVVASSEFATRW